ncbi:ArsR/SmtB family transcription factor [Amnibacterium sp.]|uniref:ArsR/SmtB family transcription factor n=1 Tax=Amnibacterium sp. TaxID=1872496 RepID=UPI003F7C739F
MADDRGPRLVDDVRALRALAHPVRLALIEHLVVDGPLTATEASELVGESPSSCSFHLRQLAKYGFVEETGEGTGRRRPWRITRLGLDFDPDAADPAVGRASAEVAALFRERQMDRYRMWRMTRSSWSEAWRRASIDSEFAFWLTPAELQAVGAELQERLLAIGRERLADPAVRPEGAAPVEVLLFGYPMGEPE